MEARKTAQRLSGHASDCWGRDDCCRFSHPMVLNELVVLCEFKLDIPSWEVWMNTSSLKTAGCRFCSVCCAKLCSIDHLWVELACCRLVHLFCPLLGLCELSHVCLQVWTVTVCEVVAKWVVDDILVADDDKARCFCCADIDIHTIFCRASVSLNNNSLACLSLPCSYKRWQHSSSASCDCRRLLTWIFSAIAYFDVKCICLRPPLVC